MRRSKAIVLTIVAGMVVAACSTGTAPDDEGAGGGDVVDMQLAGSLAPAESAEAGAAVTSFGFDLHRAVAEPGENTVTSPLSASVLLAMVAAGAGGETAAEMIELLRLDEAQDVRYAALLADLVAASDIELAVANALWAAQGYPFEEDYLAFTREVFGATLDEVDLGDQAAADAIDAWVVDRTNGLIDGIAGDLGLPDPTAVLVLVNAVYFLGEWTTKFDPDDTRDVGFTLADGTRIEVPTMHRTWTDADEAHIQTAVRDGYQILRLPYGDDERFGMEIFLPDRGLSLDDWLVSFDGDEWRAATTDLTDAGMAMVALPRFELEWDASLDAALQGLGMVSAYRGGDFTPMSPANPFLGAVVQKTYIRVDEEGTEAAAVTGGAMRTSAPLPIQIDRPFLFTVSDRDTGTVLFLGTVHDPRG